MDLLDRDDPSHIGPYQLLARLGQGGMGRVFLARSAAGALVAVKVLYPTYTGDAAFRKRFTREVDAARKVIGQYTVRLLDSDATADAPWLATDYVRGHSLADTVNNRGPLAEEMTRQLACGIALALQSVHAAGIVHRDVKPSNVLMAADGPRLVDFGVSQAVDGSTFTMSGQVLGSAGYMAPEQLEARPVSGQTDIFALGAVLVYALTGKGPFGEGSVASLLYRVVHTMPEVPHTKDPVLAEIIRRCMAKDPSERPSLAEVVTTLGPAPTAGFLLDEWLPEQAPEAPARQPGAGPTTLTAMPGTGNATQQEPAAAAPAPHRRRRKIVAVAVIAAIATALAMYAFGPFTQHDAADSNTLHSSPSASQLVAPSAVATSLPPPPSAPAAATNPPPGITTPRMPSNLTATPINTTTVRLQWTDNADNENGFLINHTGATHGVGTNTTSYDWGGLPAGAYACFAVAAFNAAGYSAYYPSAAPGWICATTPPQTQPTTPGALTVPPAPGGLTAVALRTDTIRLQWTDNSSDETGFEITNGMGTSNSTGTNTTAYDWTGLAATTNMCFQVRAYNSAGNSAYSPATASVCATTPQVNKPTNFTATLVTANTVRLQWTDNSDNETGFNIATGVATGVGGSSYGSRSTAANATSYDWSGLAAGTWRCFQINAYNGTGDSGWSNSYVCAAGTPVKPDGAPTNISIAATSPGSIRVQWTDTANNEAAFEVTQRVSYPNGNTVGGFGISPANATFYDWSGLPSGTQICVRVSAFNPIGLTSLDAAPQLPYCATAP